MKQKVIAIDGPAGAGKSTVARLVAEKLGFVYIDTGAMYRAVTCQVLAENHENMVEKKTKRLKKKLDIAIVFLIVAIILAFLFMRFVNF